MTSAAPVLAAPLASAFAQVPAGWRAVTDPFLRSAAGRALCDTVDARCAAGVAVYPPTPLLALALTPPEAVRVVILGQDPYHGPGQAQGLAFSVAPGQRLPPSLRNVLREVARDTGHASACADGDLRRWATQGVLLLNSVLTVEDGRPHSHAGRGWELLTAALLAHVAAGNAPVAFLLWGAAAQAHAAGIDPARHGLWRANHPSPLSARRPPVPFVGCGHFRAASAFLAGQGRGPPLAW